MLTTALVTVAVNSVSFYLISEMLPGFEIKSKKTAIMIAIAYSILAALSMLLVAPFAIVVSIFLTLIAFIPFIGPIIAGAGLLVTTFLVTFVLTVILLRIIDKMMDDFAMRTPTVGYIAALLLGILSVAIRFILPV